MKILVFILTMATAFLGPVLVWGVASWIARPLDRAAKNRRHPTQFTIVDFLCLFVLVQAPTALIHAIKTGTESGIQEWVPYLLDCYAWGSIGVIWWKSAEIMSRAGINTPWHRVVLLLVVLPAALVGPLLPFIFLMTTAIGMLKFSSNFWMIFTGACLAVGVPGAMILSAHLVRRMVSSSDAIAEVPVEVVDES
ncbi:MAG: hypothetical protein JW719_03030 [Pirellulales bacterium]|nr:hypothetical protein [Pirellulales bacterium]